MYFAVVSTPPPTDSPVPSSYGKMSPCIVHVHNENGAGRSTAVPLSADTTGQDLLDCVQDPGYRMVHLVAKWQEKEFLVLPTDNIDTLLCEFRDEAESSEVDFIVRYENTDCISGLDLGFEGRRSRRLTNASRDSFETCEEENLPGGGADLTVSELQGLAARQQVAIETQHQALVARETRLKYLQQQQARHRQLSAEEARLQRMRQRTEEKELEVKRVKAVRGQVEQQRNTNKHLNTELETLRARFSEQEKEMSMAGKRVESLLKQLDDLSKVKDAEKVTNTDKTKRDNETLNRQLEKLRKEVAFRNAENNKKNAQLTAQKQRLQQRKDQIARMDQRIEEIRERRTKRHLQMSPRTQTSQLPLINVPEKSGAEGSGWGSRSGQGRKLGQNVAAVEPYIQHPPKETAKDPQSTEDVWKQDPKIQTSSSGTKVITSEQDVTAQCINNNNSSSNSNTINNSKKDTNGEGEVPVEYKIPSVVSSHFGANRVRGGSVGKGSVTGHQARPGSEPSDSIPTTSQSSHTQSSGLNSPRSVSRTGGPQPQLSSFGKLPKWPPQPGSADGGDGDQSPSSPRTHGSRGEQHPLSPRTDPHINIYDEERQAGSGQSSPASSEGSGPLVKQGSGVFTSQSSTSPSSSRQLPATHATIGQSSPPVHKNDAKTTPALEPRAQHSGRQGPKPPPRLPQTVLQGPLPVVSPSAANSAISQPSIVGKTAGTMQDVARTNGRKADGCPQSSESPDGTAVGPTEPGHDGKMGTGLHLNQQPAPTYRYASKSFIANTYTGRLGNTALQRYHQLNRLYPSTATSTPTNGSTDVDPEGTANSQHLSALGGESNAGANNTQPASDNMVVVTGTGPSGMTHFGVVGAPNYPDIASDKGSYKVNTPKQVRRRHSDSDNEELAKALQKRAERLELEQLAEDATSSGNADVQPEHPEPSTSSVPNTDLADTVPSSPGKTVQSGEMSNSTVPVTLRHKPILKGDKKRKSMNHVSFDPLALLLDASLEGELDLVKKTAKEVDDVSTANDEGITALHNAICAGHLNIVQFLIGFGADVNSPDTDGWTPLHCAASCNNLSMVRFLVDHGACLFATTISDQETAAEKCEEEEDGYDGCSDYLYGVQEKLGIANNGVVYAVFDYSALNQDELSLHINDKLTVIRKGDNMEREWWWAVNTYNKEGYIPRNLLGLYPRILPANYQPLQTSEC